MWKSVLWYRIVILGIIIPPPSVAQLQEIEMRGFSRRSIGIQTQSLAEISNDEIITENGNNDNFYDTIPDTMTGSGYLEVNRNSLVQVEDQPEFTVTEWL